LFFCRVLYLSAGGGGGGGWAAPSAGPTPAGAGAAPGPGADTTELTEVKAAARRFAQAIRAATGGAVGDPIA
ncbi:hypothetical protein ABTY62_00005, partial [Streptomyces sp. NPDC097640]